MSSGNNRASKKAKPNEIISHNAFLIEKFQFSSQEFYAKVEQAMKDRQIPNIEVERIDWPEGGVLSPRREYLRATQERLLFDICGAPFGTGFFVSFWFGQKERKINWLVLTLLVLTIISFMNIIRFVLPPFLFGYPLDSILKEAISPDQRGNVANEIFFSIIMIPLMVYDIFKFRYLDTLLRTLPFIRVVYSRIFHRITYYRIDNMLMYQQAVRNAVMQVVDEITSAKGIKPMSESERKPILKELWLR